MSASEKKQAPYFNPDINPDKAIQVIPLDFPTKNPPSFEQLECKTIDDVIELLATSMAGEKSDQSDLKEKYIAILKDKSTDTKDNNLSPEVIEITQQQLCRVAYRLNELKDCASQLKDKKEHELCYQQTLLERAQIVVKLSESIGACIHGFQDRLGNIIRDLYIPKTFDGLLAKYRLEIIERCYQQLRKERSIRIGIEVHVRRACYNKANKLGFTVPMPPLDDANAEGEEVEPYNNDITKILKSTIKALYTPWHMIKFIQEQLTIPFGYSGFNQHGYRGRLHKDVLDNLRVYFTEEVLKSYCDKMDISLDFMITKKSKIVDIDLANLNKLIVAQFIVRKYLIFTKEQSNVAYIKITSRISLRYVTNLHNSLNSSINYEIAPDISNKLEVKDVPPTSDTHEEVPCLINGSCFLPDLPLEKFGSTSKERQVFLDKFAEKIPAFKDDIAAIYGPNSHWNGKPIHAMPDFRRILTVMHPDLALFATKQFLPVYFKKESEEQAYASSSRSTVDATKSESKVSRPKLGGATCALTKEGQQCSGEHQVLIIRDLLSRMSDSKWHYLDGLPFFKPFYLALRRHSVLRQELIRKSGVRDVFSLKKEEGQDYASVQSKAYLLAVLTPQDSRRIFRETRNRFNSVNSIIYYWTPDLPGSQGRLLFKGRHHLIQHLDSSEKRPWFFAAWNSYYAALKQFMIFRGVNPDFGPLLNKCVISVPDIMTFFKGIPLDWQYKVMMQELIPHVTILSYFVAGRGSDNGGKIGSVCRLAGLIKLISEQTLANQFRLLTVGVCFRKRSLVAYFLCDPSPAVRVALGDFFMKFPLNVTKELLVLATTNKSGRYYKRNQDLIKNILNGQKRMVLKCTDFFESILAHKKIFPDDEKKQEPIVQQLQILVKVFPRGSLRSFRESLFSKNSAFENALQPLLNAAVNWGINLTDKYGLETLQSLADHATEIRRNGQSSLKGMKLFHHVCKAYFLSGKTTLPSRVDWDEKKMSEPLISKIAAFNRSRAVKITPGADNVAPIVAAMYAFAKQNSNDAPLAFELYLKHIKNSQIANGAKSNSEIKAHPTNTKIDALLLLIKHCGKQRKNLRWLLHHYPSALTDEDEFNKVCEVLVMANQHLALDYKKNPGHSLLRHSPYRHQLKLMLVEKLRSFPSGMHPNMSISLTTAFQCSRFKLWVCLDENDLGGRMPAGLFHRSPYHSDHFLKRPEMQTPFLRYIKSRSVRGVKTFLVKALSRSTGKERRAILMVKGEAQKTTCHYLLKDFPYVLGIFFKKLKNLLKFFQSLTPNNERFQLANEFAAASFELLHTTSARDLKVNGVALFKVIHNPLFLAALRSKVTAAAGKRVINKDSVLCELLTKSVEPILLSEAKAVTLLRPNANADARETAVASSRSSLGGFRGQVETLGISPKSSSMSRPAP